MNRKYLKYGMYAVGGVAAFIIGAKLLHGGNAAASGTGMTGSTDLGSTLGIPFSSGDIAAGASGSTAATGSASDAAVQAEIQALLGQLNNPTAPAAGQDAASLFHDFFSRIGPGIGTAFSAGHATFTVNGVPESFDFSLTPITTPAVTPTPTTPGGSQGGTGNPTPGTNPDTNASLFNFSPDRGNQGNAPGGLGGATPGGPDQGLGNSPGSGMGTPAPGMTVGRAIMNAGIVFGNPVTIALGLGNAIINNTTAISTVAGVKTLVKSVTTGGNLVGNSVGGHEGGNVQHGGDKMGDNHGQFGGADVSGHDTGNVGGGNGPSSGGGGLSGGGRVGA